MREGLFRGKRLRDKEWVHGWLCDVWWLERSLCIVPDCIETHYDTIEGFCPIDESTVGQYTGKRDSKNDRIFEGDILHIKWRTLDLAENAVVRYDDRSCAYILNMRGAAWSYMSHLDAAYMQIESFEVIGNMWDDPELTEGIQCG